MKVYHKKLYCGTKPHIKPYPNNESSNETVINDEKK